MNAAPAHTTQTTEVKLPAWVDQASQANYNRAKAVANRPLQQWQGQDVVDPSSMTTDAYSMLTNNAGAATPDYTQAAALENKAGSALDPIYAKAQGILSDVGTAGWDPSTYLNPYTNEVENRAINNANISLTQQLQSASDKARAAGAFGGSAASVQQGVLAAQGAKGIGDLSAQLRAQGYDTATANMLADRASKTNAANAMISGASTQGNQWLNAASGLTSTGSALDTSNLKDAAGLLAAGQQDTAQRQAVLDAQKAKFEQRVNYPLEKLNILMSSLGMSPYGKTESVDKTSTAEKQGPDFATIGMGLLSMLPMLSDKRAKKNINKLGTDPATKLPMYSFQYKGAPASTPKSVGPMAQDVEKKFPDMVGQTPSGMKTIHPGILAATSGFTTKVGNQKPTDTGLFGEGSLSPALMSKRRPIAGSKFKVPVFT